MSRIPYEQLQRYVFAGFLAVASVALAGASCKKSSATPEGEPSDVVEAIDKSEGEGNGKTGDDGDEAAGNDDGDEGKKDPHAGHAHAEKPDLPPLPSEPKSTAPLDGVDLPELDGAKKKRFYILIESLSSPCGKPHSLRKSVETDKDCKRAPFAARYVAEMLTDQATDDDVRELYDARYRDRETFSFELGDTPHAGPASAPVKVVEFYDYGCPACKAFKPLLEEALADFPKQAAIYYKQYPLTHAHPDSAKAAQAVLAANKQGKFQQMHDLLFQMSPRHKKKDILGYAAKLGLDMTKFEDDYASAAKQVKRDTEEGDDAGVQGTPTVYINGQMYQGPSHPKYIKLWIEEELAVNG